MTNCHFKDMTVWACSTRAHTPNQTKPNARHKSSGTWAVLIRQQLEDTDNEQLKMHRWPWALISPWLVHFYSAHEKSDTTQHWCFHGTEDTTFLYPYLRSSTDITHYCLLLWIFSDVVDYFIYWGKKTLKAGKVYESQIKMVVFPHSNYTLRWYTSAGTDSQLKTAEYILKLTRGYFRMD